eukprot:CAMPEP_0179336834 /NCGR_PEP_ID=MMETSP0797-20121207/67268_1 /TAXON_ID=47934 /ORGANISM="Dinophysis acuminata, Strain DAEP01" /LENGTH=110 /DNA_ID=CAMNT_0021050375 /DNA_START=462 /DNA_END=794 /DNA_ORIENTATION=+
MPSTIGPQLLCDPVERALVCDPDRHLRTLSMYAEGGPHLALVVRRAPEDRGGLAPRVREERVDPLDLRPYHVVHHDVVRGGHEPENLHPVAVGLLDPQNSRLHCVVELEV